MTKQERAACSKIYILLKEYEEHKEHSYSHGDNEKAEMYRVFMNDLKAVYNLLAGYVSNLLLTDEERKYLGNVIKPFRDNVLCIQKSRYNGNEYIAIYYTEIENDECINCVNLPAFRPGKHFSVLEIEKNYTVEELGL